MERCRSTGICGPQKHGGLDTNQSSVTALHGQWHFGIVALNDGRFSVDGTVSQIEANSETPYRREYEPEGRKIVYATRVEAIRVAAARMIQQILRTRQNKYVGIWDRIDRKTMTDVINWTRAKVAEACQSAMPAPISIAELPPHPAPRPEAGLPLFEIKPNAGTEARGNRVASGVCRGQRLED
jgi:hypothetical protein